MKQPIDAAQRTAALDTGRSHHVESPAGSGKTLLLTCRFLKLLGEVRNPSEILAITFTEKAAGEMRQRIIGFLEGRASSGDPDGELTVLAQRAIEAHADKAHLLTAPDMLNIMTFHGFCSYVARRAPLEAGVTPDFDIIDDNEQTILVEETVRAALKGFFAYPASDSRRIAFENRLLYHNNNWRGISDEFAGILKNRDRFRELVELIRNTGGKGLSELPAVLDRRLRIYVEGRLGALVRHLGATELGRCWSELTADLVGRGASLGDELPSTLPASNWEELSVWQTISNALTTKAGTPRKSFGPASGFYSGFSKTKWGEMITSMGDPCSDGFAEVKTLPSPGDIDSDIDILSDFIIIAADLIDRYEKTSREKHVIDFPGLEQAALRALSGSDPSDIHLYLDHRIQHLLVDEFQDTNRAQWELVSRICGGWSPEDNRTVFIVGDPKQSIYSFRNAEVSLFTDAKGGIPLPGGGIIPLDTHLLTTNFRSRGKLIEWINGLFGEVVMRDPDSEADEVPFNPSERYDDGTGGTVSLTLFADNDQETAKENEAAWLAGKVGETLRTVGEETSIGVLLFTRTRINRYLRAFQEHGIPVRARDGLGLAQRPEVMHLMKIAELLAYPHDDLAWASILRSPWSWFDMNILYETAMRKPESWMEKILVTADDHPEMDLIRKAIENAIRRVGRDPLGKTVRTFWEDLDGPRKTAARYGMAGIANCMRFFEILDDAHRGIPLETLRQANAVIASCYEPADPASSRSPVEIMTIHGAKGLEFDIVFLPFMDWAPLSNIPATPPPYLMERVPGTEGEYLVAMGKDRRRKETPPVFNLLKSLNRKRQWGEAKRRFYVAATRAKEALFMSAVTRIDDANTLKKDTGTILNWVTQYEEIGETEINSIPAGKHIPVTINPDISSPAPDRTPAETILPEPYKLQPERPAYMKAKSPSSFASEAFQSEEKLSGDEGDFKRARGTVVHAILNTAILGRNLPSQAAVSRAMRAEDIGQDRADESAAGILEEVRLTLADPFILRLIQADEVKSEWEIEDTPLENRIRAGSLDLAAREGNTWWICDFKTSRPETGQTVDEFIAHERELYRPQLEAYRQMMEHLKKTGTLPFFSETSQPETAIRIGIYLTGLQRWEELTNPE